MLIQEVGVWVSFDHSLYFFQTSFEPPTWCLMPSVAQLHRGHFISCYRTMLAGRQQVLVAWLHGTGAVSCVDIGGCMEKTDHTHIKKGATFYFSEEAKVLICVTTPLLLAVSNTSPKLSASPLCHLPCIRQYSNDLDGINV